MEAFLKCFMDKNKGQMDMKCIQKLKELLPEDAGIPRPTLVSAIINFFFFDWTLLPFSESNNLAETIVSFPSFSGTVKP